MSNGVQRGDNDGPGAGFVARITDEMEFYDGLDPSERYVIDNCAVKISAMNYIDERAEHPSTLRFLATRLSPHVPASPRLRAEQARIDRHAIALMRQLSRSRRPSRR